MKPTTRRLTTNARVINEVLTKYKNTFSALCELINNSIQADSKHIDIIIDYVTDVEVCPSPIRSIAVIDDGVGVSLSEFNKKILQIGNTAKAGGQGIGRFGALQIGRKMLIETIAHDKNLNRFTKVSLPLNAFDLGDSQLDTVDLECTEEILTGNKHKTHYKVLIEDLHHNKYFKKNRKNQLSQELLANSIKPSLFEKYPYEIFNGLVKFSINGEEINRDDFVKGSPIYKRSEFEDARGEKVEVNFCFYQLNSDLNKVKIFLQHDNAGIKSVAYEYTYTSNYYTPDLGTWFVYIDSDFINVDLFRNIELGDLLEQEFGRFKQLLKDTVNNFFRERNKGYEEFTEKFKYDSQNPLAETGALNDAHQNIFNKAAYIVENEYHLLKNNSSIRGLIYELMDRSIRSGQIEEIFKKVLKLDDKAVEEFHSLLERTELESVIQFANQVATKTDFLEFLHTIVYGELGKVLRERSQLHKIIEKNLWVFGENYTDTPTLWSDKKIANIFNDIRNEYLVYEPTVKDTNLIEEMADCPGIDDITDLFFHSEKLLDNGKKEYMVVELKSPKCSIGQKELSQIEKYAFAIESNPALPTEGVEYKLILVSTRATAFAKSKLKSQRKAYGEKPFIYEKKDADKHIETMVMTWSEIIELNKRRLNYMSNGLETKGLDIGEVFESEYSNIINDKVVSILRKSSSYLV